MTKILGRNRAHPARSSVSYRQQGHPCSGKRGWEGGKAGCGALQCNAGKGNVHEAMAAGREEHVSMCYSGIGVFQSEADGKEEDDGGREASDEATRQG